MPKLVFVDKGTFESSINFPKPTFECQYIEYDHTSNEEILVRCIDADYVITNKVVFDKKIISHLPNLKHIAVAATGTNCVDLPAASNANITVSNVPAYGTHSVSEHTFAMILSLRRHLLAYKQDIQNGKWQASKHFCFFNHSINDIAGSTIGLVGTGAIAQQVAKIASVMGMHVIFHSISGRSDLPEYTMLELPELLKKSDVVSLHCPFTSQTNHLINASTLQLMKPNALLINTARGQIVDLDALRAGLLKGQIMGAGIDVAPQEPPLENATVLKLNDLPNCIVTPHTAWASRQAMLTLIKQVALNIEAFHNGVARNIVVAR